MHKILLTGAAGFIGYHTFRKLVSAGCDVIGLDNLNNYYDVNLKMTRLECLGFESAAIAYGRMMESSKSGRFVQLNLEDAASMVRLFHKEKFDAVCHLGAQAGVRFSVENPSAYIQSNINGFFNVLEGCRENAIKHLVFASSSSVYGDASQVPFAEDEPCMTPVSLYAVTKQSNETMAQCYARLYKIPTTGLRFFTVYGPWGRPDMALFKFTKAILNDQLLPVYNYGDMQRDFTYVDDIVEGVQRVLLEPKHLPDAQIKYSIYNIGGGKPVGLMDFVNALEKVIGKKARLDLLPLQQGDVYRTWANTEKLQKDYGFTPSVPLETGVRNFVEWYRDFYDI